jgi:hypothetical protein
MTDWIWPIVAAVAIAAWAGVRVHRERLRHRLAAERERMLHEERLAAMRDRNWAELGLDIAHAHVPREEAAVDAHAMIRHAALAAGLVLLLAGIGYVVGIALVPETRETLGLREMATIGLIPAMAGAGLLAYVYLTRGEHL